MMLRRKTSLLLAVVITVALGVTGLFYLQFLETSIKHSIFSGVQSVSETTSEAISRFLDDTLREAQAVAHAIPVEALEEKNAPLVEERLKTLLKVFPKFQNGMFILDSKARLWVDYPAHPKVRGRLFAFREYFQRTMNEKRGIIGTPYRSARTGEPVLTFTALLRGSVGQVLGLLGCSVQILSPNALGGIRTTTIGRSGYIYVYDTSRLMILHPKKERVLERDVPVGANRLFDAALEGFEGVGETVNSRGVHMLLSLKRIPGTDWIIGSQQPKDEAYAPLKEARRRIIYGIVLAVLLAILVGSVAIRRITEPLARLRRAVMRLGMGEGQGDPELKDELKGIRGGDEIGELAGVFRDISRRLDQTLSSLRESATDWERTFDSVPDLIAILDESHRIVRLNKAMADALGMDPQDAVGLRCHQLVHGTDEPPLFCPHRRMLEDGAEHTEEFYEARLGRDLAVTTSPLRDGQGTLIGSVHLARDITDRRRAQRAIIESEKVLAKINESFLGFGSDHIANINSLTALAGELLGAACALYNRLEGDLLVSVGTWNTPADYNPVDRPEGHICYDVIQEAGDDILTVRDLPNTRYAKTDPNVEKYQLKTYIGKAVKSGGKPLGSLCVVYQEDFEPSPADIKAFQIVASAIGVEEERKQAEEEKNRLEARLQQAQKMEAIGTLAGGVAHDLNNILSGLVSYPELILLDLPKDSPVRDSVITIRESGKKAATIVQDMLTLARRGVTVTEVVNLNDTISEYVASPECAKLKSFHTNVDITTRLEPDLLNISGSPVHLSKVLMNLVSNAAEAMPAGGETVISSRNRYIDKPVHGYDDVEEGDYVVLSVLDTGIGISAQDLKRIFEPFYTKKVMGRSGTGLGMAVVWSTLKDHKGYIDIHSTEGEGTRFDLFFPVTREEAGRREGRVSIESFVGNEKILVVDDVKEQREIASKMLGKLGYSVATVASGEEAVAYLKEKSADLIVLDMIMDPGIDGLETYRRVTKLNPGQRAIIASGFSETERVRDAQKLGAGEYIKKPYTLEKLAVAVRGELDR